MILISVRIMSEFLSEQPRPGQGPVRRSARGQRAGVDVCVSGSEAGRLLKTTTWLPLAQHVLLVFQPRWRGVCGLAGVQQLTSNGPAHPMEHNKEIHPPTPVLASPVWSYGRPPDKSRLTYVGLCASNNLVLEAQTEDSPDGDSVESPMVSNRLLHQIRADNKHLEQCAIV